MEGLRTIYNPSISYQILYPIEEEIEVMIA